MSQEPCQREYDFTFVLSDDVLLTDDLENAIHGGACDDATISVRSGRVYLTFSRRAPSIRDAILGAIADFKAAEVSGTVLRVDQLMDGM